MSNDNDWLIKKMGQTPEVEDILPMGGSSTGIMKSNNMNNMNNKIVMNKESSRVPHLQEQNNRLMNHNGIASASNEQFRNDIQDKYTIKKNVVAKLNEELKDKENPNENYMKTYIDKFLSAYNIPGMKKKEIMQEILWDLNGYGIIQPFLDDETVTEIICCSYDNIWVERFGKLQPTDVKFANEKELRNLIDKIVQPLGRRIDDAQPYVNARLKDQSRVNAVINPLSADGATLDIRKFARQVFTMKDYVEKGSMIPEMTEFIKWVTITRKNIVVSGGTGSGKTTLLNCISRFIPQSEAIITIEDLLELQLTQPCLRRLEARGQNAEGKGAITIRDLVVNALRMRPDRLIVGECRSFEVVDMLQAMNTGHDGSMTTVHSNNAKECIERLTTMYLFSGLDIPEIAIKSQIASAVHVIIQAQRLDDGSRKIIQISEVLGLGRRGAERNNEHVEKFGLDKKFLIKGVDNKEVYIQDIFKYDEINQEFVITGWIPTFFEQMKKKGSTLTEESFSYRTIKAKK